MTTFDELFDPNRLDRLWHHPEEEEEDGPRLGEPDEDDLPPREAALDALDELERALARALGPKASIFKRRLEATRRLVEKKLGKDGEAVAAGGESAEGEEGGEGEEEGVSGEDALEVASEFLPEEMEGGELPSDAGGGDVGGGDAGSADAGSGDGGSGDSRDASDGRRDDRDPNRPGRRDENQVGGVGVLQSVGGVAAAVGSWVEGLSMASEKAQELAGEDDPAAEALDKTYDHLGTVLDEIEDLYESFALTRRG